MVVVAVVRSSTSGAPASDRRSPSIRNLAAMPVSFCSARSACASGVPPSLNLIVLRLARRLAALEPHIEQARRPSRARCLCPRSRRRAGSRPRASVAAQARCAPAARSAARRSCSRGWRSCRRRGARCGRRAPDSVKSSAPTGIASAPLDLRRRRGERAAAARARRSRTTARCAGSAATRRRAPRENRRAARSSLRRCAISCLHRIGGQSRRRTSW